MPIAKKEEDHADVDRRAPAWTSAHQPTGRRLASAADDPPTPAVNLDQSERQKRHSDDRIGHPVGRRDHLCESAGRLRSLARGSDACPTFTNAVVIPASGRRREKSAARGASKGSIVFAPVRAYSHQYAAAVRAPHAADLSGSLPSPLVRRGDPDPRGPLPHGSLRGPPDRRAAHPGPAVPAHPEQPPAGVPPGFPGPPPGRRAHALGRTPPPGPSRRRSTPAAKCL